MPLRWPASSAIDATPLLDIREQVAPFKGPVPIFTQYCQFELVTVEATVPQPLSAGHDLMLEYGGSLAQVDHVDIIA